MMSMLGVGEMEEAELDLYTFFQPGKCERECLWLPV